MDYIFSASQIIEKHREFNIPTYIAFIDFKKAFDSVDRDKLWTIMLSKGIPTHLITIIQKIYIYIYKIMKYLRRDTMLTLLGQRILLRSYTEPE